MPLYLFRGRYSAEGLKGLLKEGGVKRRATVTQMIEQAGGRVHGLWYALGDDDVYVVTELPDLGTVTALSLAVNASGLVKLKTTALMTPEDVDAASKKTVNYRAPGA